MKHIKHALNHALKAFGLRVHHFRWLLEGYAPSGMQLHMSAGDLALLAQRLFFFELAALARETGLEAYFELRDQNPFIAPSQAELPHPCWKEFEQAALAELMPKLMAIVKTLQAVYRYGGLGSSSTRTYRRGLLKVIEYARHPNPDEALATIKTAKDRWQQLCQWAEQSPDGMAFTHMGIWVRPPSVGEWHAIAHTQTQVPVFEGTRFHLPKALRQQLYATARRHPSWLATYPTHVKEVE